MASRDSKYGSEESEILQKWFMGALGGIKVVNGWWTWHYGAHLVHLYATFTQKKKLENLLSQKKKKKKLENYYFKIKKYIYNIFLYTENIVNELYIYKNKITFNY